MASVAGDEYTTIPVAVVQALLDASGACVSAHRIAGKPGENLVNKLEASMKAAQEAVNAVPPIRPSSAEKRTWFSNKSGSRSIFGRSSSRPNSSNGQPATGPERSDSTDSNGGGADPKKRGGRRGSLEPTSLGDAIETIKQYQGHFEQHKRLLSFMRSMSYGSLREFAKVTQTIVTTLVSSETCCLFLVDEHSGELTLAEKTSKRRVSELSNDSSDHVPAARNTVVGHCALNNEKVNLALLSQEHSFQGLTDEVDLTGVRNVLAAPVRNEKGRAVAVLCVTNQKSPGNPLEDDAGFNLDDEVAIDQVGEVVANALRVLGLLNDEQTSRKRLEELVRAVRLVATEDKSEGIMNRVFEMTRELVDCESVTCFRLKQAAVKGGQELLVVSNSADTSVIGVEMRANAGLAGAVYESRATMIVNDAYNDKRFNPKVDQCTGFKTRGLLCVPVLSDSKSVVAVIEAVNKRRGRFNDLDVKVTEYIAAIAGISIAKAESMGQAVQDRRMLASRLHLVESFSSRASFSLLVKAFQEGAMKLIPMRSFRLWIYDKSESILWSSDFSESESDRVLVIPAGRGLVGACADSLSSVVVKDAPAHPLYDSQIDGTRFCQKKSCIVLPVLDMWMSAPDQKSELLAVVEAIDREPDSGNGIGALRTTCEFNADDVRNLELYCNELAHALRSTIGEAPLFKEKATEIITLGTKEADKGGNGAGGLANTVQRRSRRRRNSTAQLMEMYRQGSVGPTGFGGADPAAAAAAAAAAANGDANDSPAARAVAAKKARDAAARGGTPSGTNSPAPHPQRKLSLIGAGKDAAQETLLDDWHIDFLGMSRSQLAEHIVRIFEYYNLISGEQRKNFAYFIEVVEVKYLHNDYHTFAHGVHVMHAVQVMLRDPNMEVIFQTEHMLRLKCALIAALCHDIHHPGTSNTYMINARTEESVMYGDDATLERHHLHVTLETLRDPKTNPFGELDLSEYKTVKAYISSAILSTDMSRHAQIVQGTATIKAPHPTPFAPMTSSTTFNLCDAVVHAADMAAQSTKAPVFLKWGSRCLSEFKAQVIKEHEEGLPALGFMENLEAPEDQANVQGGFCSAVLIPLWREIARLLPTSLKGVTQQLEANVKFYQNEYVAEYNAKRIPDMEYITDIDARMKEKAERIVALEAAQKKKDEAKAGGGDAANNSKSEGSPAPEAAADGDKDRPRRSSAAASLFEKASDEAEDKS